MKNQNVSVFVSLLMCGAASVAQAGVDVLEDGTSRLTLSINQSEQTIDKNLQIKFVDVLDDSRCPLSVVCFWQGVANVKLQLVHVTEGVKDIVLPTYGTSAFSNDLTTSVGAYNIEVERLFPYPITTGGINSSDYQVSLIIKQ